MLLSLLSACVLNTPDGEKVKRPVVRLYPDTDGDGFGAEDGRIDVHTSGVAGYVNFGGDCDDADPVIHPGAEELCDQRDSDCDGRLGAEEQDRDADGMSTCDGDCDDGNSLVRPGLPEQCDGLDNNCSGRLTVEEQDRDRDGWLACMGDCDPGLGQVYPGAPERCDGLDNDCDGLWMEGEEDADGDGDLRCNNDCDDQNPDVGPTAGEACNFVDDTCDGSADEGCPAPASFDPADCDLIVPTDQPTVQDAIDAATDGMEVCVLAGRWRETIDLRGRAIHLRGAYGPAFTVLDGSYAGTVVTIASGEGPATVLSGFTIQSGSSDPGVPSGWGAGIHMIGSSPTLHNLWVQDNHVWYDWSIGGGVLIEGGSPVLRNLRVRDNSTAHAYCGADYGSGGGITLVGAAADMDNIWIEGNYAGESGGGLALFSSTVLLRHAYVADNRTGRGGGAGVYLEDSTLILENFVVKHNLQWDYWVPASGGGLYLRASTAQLYNGVIADNEAELRGGGLMLGGGQISMVNTIVAFNYAGTAGGGMAGSATSLELAWSDLWQNAPEDADSSLLDGSGILFVDPDFSGRELRLDSGSPLVDAGDPALLDPDGTASDMGALGGPAAAGWDLDGDGVPAWWKPEVYDPSSGLDCDDLDAAVLPGRGC